MRVRSLLAVVCSSIAAASLAAACGSSTEPLTNGGGDAGGGGNDGSLVFGDGSGGGHDGTGGMQCQNDSDCGPGGVCDPQTHTCGCGGTVVDAMNVPPNLLVTLDRSCSMTGAVGSSTKWAIAVKAMQNLTTTFKDKIRFGLELFPERKGSNKCAEDAIDIPVGPGNESTIDTLLAKALMTTDPNYPSGPCVTNIDTAMIRAATDPGFNDMTRASYAMLLTDGMQAGCNLGGGDNGTVQAITDLFNKGVHTFVVGFGSGVSVTSLNSFAQAGGEVNAAGPNKFYQANDQASLDAVFNTIATHALSCTLNLSAPPPNGDPSLIFVYLNKTPPPLPRDTTHQNGWDYDSVKNAVIFYGVPCTQLKSGMVTSVSVVFGCTGAPPPPPPK